MLRRRVSRIVSFLATLVVLLGFATLVGPPSAQATVYPLGPSLGWLRMQPTSGTLEDAVVVLSQKPCVKGDGVVASISGPEVPTTGDVGNILGDTNLKAIPPTFSGQLYVPLSYTFAYWFGRNLQGKKPLGTYTLSVVCRDRISPLKVYGHFSGQFSVDAQGRFRALGEAAKPFDTQAHESDALGIPASPSPSSASGSSAAPGATPGDPASPSQLDPSASQAASTEVAAPAGSASSGSGSRWILILVAAGLVVAVAIATLRGRGTVAPSPGRHAGDSDSTSTEDAARTG